MPNKRCIKRIVRKRVEKSKSVAQALNFLVKYSRSYTLEVILSAYARGADHYDVSAILGITFEQWYYYRKHVASDEVCEKIKHARRLSRDYKEEENMRKAARGL